MCICWQVFVFAGICVCVCICWQVFVFAGIYVCMCWYVCVYSDRYVYTGMVVYMLVCVYVQAGTRPAHFISLLHTVCLR